MCELCGILQNGRTARTFTCGLRSTDPHVYGTRQMPLLATDAEDFFKLAMHSLAKHFNKADKDDKTGKW